MTTDEKCLYRAWTHKVNDAPCKAQACMPDDGINDLFVHAWGQTVTMADGAKYQVIKCKYPECL